MTDSSDQYKKQEVTREAHLFETDEARYFLAVRQEYQPITGGINTDLSLRRQEIEKSVDPFVDKVCDRIDEARKLGLLT